MNKLLIILLCIFICWCNLVNTYALTNQRSEQEENEERIVVKQLAKMIRNSQENLKNQREKDDYDSEKAQSEVDGTNDEYIPAFSDSESSSFEYKSPPMVLANDEVASNKQPFAVPPTDYRYYEKDFSEAAEPLQEPPSVPQQQQPADTAPVTLSLSSTTNSKKEPLNETEEEIQRRKLYAHLTLNPSFIPYGQVQSLRLPAGGYYYNDKNGTYFLALIYGTVCAILVITSGAAYVFYRKLRKNVKDAEDVDYPAYGVTGPSKDAPAPTGDRHLAHSAQMYHYQHQKQQIIAMEKNSSPHKIRKGTESGSEEDDMTVYECPGLAPVTGEMEVKNPMFQDEEEVKISTTAAKESTNQKQTSNLEVRKSSK
ncbi:protein cab-1 [Planococcus citri]|uniref:protein cab-1 n=1 Tax=Planococcus citri TaxID=170843 RepID=UPI0031F73F1D